MQIAIVHDYLNQYGGAERVVEVLNEIFPEAPIFTSIYIPENLPDRFGKMDIRTSYMQKFPLLNKHFKKYLMFYPNAIESFDLHEYDVVLSSSSAFAKGVIKRPDACHICYCYSPMRFVWDYDRYIEKEDLNKVFLKILPLFLNKLKKWDLDSNNNINEFIAVSENIRKKILKCYNRESKVIYPPVNLDLFMQSETKEDYFLIVSRLNSYKRIDLAIEAFNKLNLPLRIIGDGPQRKNLEAMAKANIMFMGIVSDYELAEHYSKCQALVFPGDEDFGLAPVECQASGSPVIAFAAGGALETVVEGETGILFREQNVDSLINAINIFLELGTRMKKEKIIENANRFNKEVFKAKIIQYINACAG